MPASLFNGAAEPKADTHTFPAPPPALSVRSSVAISQLGCRFRLSPSLSTTSSTSTVSSLAWSLAFNSWRLYLAAATRDT